MRSVLLPQCLFLDVELVDNTPLVEGDKVLFKYPTNENDWPYEDEEQFCERVSKGIKFMYDQCLLL